MSYAQLQTDFAAWAVRTDLNDLLPRFVALFEMKVSRRLRLRQQESAFSGTVASNEIALPSDFVAFKALWRSELPQYPLQALPLDVVLQRTEGAATAYAVQGTTIRFDGDGDITGVYYAAVPGLQTNGTTWLSALAYDAYLYGALSEASVYSLDDQRATLYQARQEAIIADLIGNDQRDRYSGRLSARGTRN